MKKPIISLFVLFSFLPASYCQEAAKGQWDGELDFSAGSNFVQEMSSRKFSHSSGDISAWGRYRTEKFSIRLDLQCLSNFAAASTTGSTANVKNPAAPQVNMDINHNESFLFDESAGVQMEYTPDDRNVFSLNFKQKLDRQVPERLIISMHNSLRGDDLTDVTTKTYLDVQERNQNVTEYSAQAKWDHKFDKAGRTISTAAGWTLNRNDDYSSWYRMSMEPLADETAVDYAAFRDFSDLAGDTDEKERSFRFTPLDTKNEFRASVLYRDVNLFGKESLNLELGANLRMILERDRLSAANCVNEVWVDSLEYRKNFNYLLMDLAPAAKLSYSPGRFSFNLQLVPDIYANKLDSDVNRGSLDFSKVYLLPDMSIAWTPSTNHKAGITYKQGLVRPTYLQICPFRRTGSNADEDQEGNSGLKPSRNGTASLFYTFHSGFFTGTLEGTEKITWDRIDRVFRNEGVYRIYTWFNSGRSFDNSIKLTLKADLKNFNAEIGGYYNYNIGYNNAGDASRNSDWGVNGNAVLKVKGGWTFNVKGRYQSKITRTYTSMTEYVGCDVRISKDFKRFLVYVEGNDLFDRPIMITTYSADKTYARFEERFHNRRIISIGASFKF